MKFVKPPLSKIVVTMKLLVDMKFELWTRLREHCFFVAGRSSPSHIEYLIPGSVFLCTLRMGFPSFLPPSLLRSFSHVAISRFHYVDCDLIRRSDRASLGLVSFGVAVFVCLCLHEHVHRQLQMHVTVSLVKVV